MAGRSDAPDGGFVDLASDALAADTGTRSEQPSAGQGSSRQPVSPSPSPRPQLAAVEDDALDLGSAVLPVLIRRYAGLAGAAVAGLAIGWVIGRRS